MLILSFPTTQQCLTRLDNLTLSSITFLFFQSIALTTSKGKQYFCTVFFSFLIWWFMNTSNPMHKRREQNLNHPTYVISIEKGCHRTVHRQWVAHVTQNLNSQDFRGDYQSSFQITSERHCSSTVMSYRVKWQESSLCISCHPKMVQKVLTAAFCNFGMNRKFSRKTPS